MTINEAIAQLVALREKHGNVGVMADCPKCGESFICDMVVIAPETARLQGPRP